MMKLAFSTLGCPNWELDQIVETAESLGYDGVELRAVGGSLDLLARREFMNDQLNTTRLLFADRSVEICCVDTSCTFHSSDRQERSAQIDSAIAHGFPAELNGTSPMAIPSQQFPQSIT